MGSEHTMASTFLKRNTVSLLSKQRCLSQYAIRSAVTYVDSAEEFNKIVATEKKVIVVDYYADWCVPCKRMRPVFERLSNEFEEKCQFIGIDIEKFHDLAQALEIRSIPTFDFIKNKKL